MTGLRFSGWCIIGATLIVAFILMILPLPSWAVSFRPAWLLLVVLCWGIILPHRVGLGIAWTCGLLLDSLQGTLLGENALCFALLSYLVFKFYRPIRQFSLIVQSIVVFMLILLNQLLLFLLQGLQGQVVSVQWFFGVILVSTLLWPWIFMVLNNCLKRYRLH